MGIGATRTPPASSTQAPPPPPSRGRSVRRGVLGALIVVALPLAALVVAVLFGSGTTLELDPVALAHVAPGPLAGTLEKVRAFGPDGHQIAVKVDDGRITPRKPLAPGEQVKVDVVVRRPGWLAWALGDTQRKRLVLRTPEARVKHRWMSVAHGSPVRVKLDQPVRIAAYGPSGRLTRRKFRKPRRTLSLGRQAAAGTLLVAAAPRTWERLGSPQHVSWFPPSRKPSAVASPAPGAKISPATPLRLTFSKPVRRVLGSALPKLDPGTPGSWGRPDGHTLVFTPSGYGAALGGKLSLKLPRTVALVGSDGSLSDTSTLTWTVPGGSTLRLQQLLAEQGYLPLDFKPSGDPIAKTAAAQASAAVTPPHGQFSWRWGNVPGELRGLWDPGHPNGITRGAVMDFQSTHGLDVDAVAGPAVWHALLADAVAGRRAKDDGYSYVYVHRDASPQTLTLWSSGKTVMTTPANTGVAAAPTELGTFPVFEHIASGTMSGTNPDGSHYNDPGIRWISYFNGGDAVHAFDRASFGTPQSVGCVELPLAAAAKVWPYMPIGTLVTIEG